MASDKSPNERRGDFFTSAIRKKEEKKPLGQDFLPCTSPSVPMFVRSFVIEGHFSILYVQVKDNNNLPNPPYLRLVANKEELDLSTCSNL